MITADREFTARHRGHPVGRHVGLRCPDPAAESVLMRALPELVPLLQAHEILTVSVSATVMTAWFPNGGTSIASL